MIDALINNVYVFLGGKNWCWLGSKKKSGWMDRWMHASLSSPAFVIFRRMVKPPGPLVFGASRDFRYR